jgi:hypothetical protein
MTGQEREALEAAYRHDVEGACGPVLASNRTWHREGFEAGYRAALCGDRRAPMTVTDEALELLSAFDRKLEIYAEGGDLKFRVMPPVGNWADLRETSRITSGHDDGVGG